MIERPSKERLEEIRRVSVGFQFTGELFAEIDALTQERDAWRDRAAVEMARGGTTEAEAVTRQHNEGIPVLRQLPVGAPPDPTQEQPTS